MDGRQGQLRPKLTHRGGEEFLIYHPNAAAHGRAAKVDADRTAGVRLDFSAAPGTFAVEWYRALDGVAQPGAAVSGGAPVVLTAPWPGQDVVVRLVRQGD